MVRRSPSARPLFAWAALLASAAPFSAAGAQQIGTPGGASLRDLTTDRPDTTESPFTIDAGHIQIETTLFGYARAPRDPNGDVAETFEFATTNLRIGLTPSLEIDLVAHPYAIASPGGGAARQDGIGAVDIRAKLNLWGNDGGTTAFALLPYVTIPIDRQNGVSPVDIEYGLLVPLSIELGGRFGFGVNAGVNARRDDQATPYRVYGVGTASLAVAWSDRVSSYYEMALEAGGNRPAAISLNSGVTWLVRNNLQLDAGTQFGVSGDAPIFAPFIGFSLRL
ncbi:MAG: transporter [Sphingomonas sp.]|nr:transporter [Sphingomonas sp.]